MVSWRFLVHYNFDIQCMGQRYSRFIKILLRDANHLQLFKNMHNLHLRKMHKCCNTMLYKVPTNNSSILYAIL